MHASIQRPRKKAAKPSERAQCRRNQFALPMRAPPAHFDRICGLRSKKTAQGHRSCRRTFGGVDHRAHDGAVAAHHECEPLSIEPTALPLRTLSQSPGIQAPSDRNRGGATSLSKRKAVFRFESAHRALDGPLLRTVTLLCIRKCSRAHQNHADADEAAMPHLATSPVSALQLGFNWGGPDSVPCTC
jgi:hypothetical protein